MAELKRDIKYINKDFNSLMNRLIEYTKNYFHNTFNDIFLMFPIHNSLTLNAASLIASLALAVIQAAKSTSAQPKPWKAMIP